MAASDRKIAYINLTTGEIETKPITPAMRKKWLGGRALDAYLMYNHIKPGVDALGPDNVLFVSAGALVGTLATASARTHVAAKSPLTNYFGSTNMGGFFSPELRWAGFDHLVIRGKAEKPVYLWVHNGKIEIRDAGNLWGKGVIDTQEGIRAELNDREIKAMTIGIGGENLVRYANVMTELKNSGGRTGMGAVMGSKNLKAIAVRGTLDIPIAHPQEAIDYNFKVIQQVVGAKVSQEQSRLGTAFIWGATNSQGLVRTRNFQLNQLDNSDDVETERLDEFVTGMMGCFGCQVHCRPKYRIPSGPLAGTYAEGPEYTSQGAFASLPQCRTAETILIGNHLVNDYGLDTLEIGSIIAWAMELYEKGIITDKDTRGLDLSWGNDATVLELVHQIAKREGIGNILAEGGLRAAKIFGKGAEKYLIHVKGMSNLQSDERPTPALALGIATASRGSDHLRSRPAIDLYHLPESVLRQIYSQPVKYDGPLSSEYTVYEGKSWQVFWQENCYMAVDALGICKYHTTFLGATLPNFEEWSKLIYYNLGIEMSPKDIWDVAERANNMERLFNMREGLTRKDDWLVDRYFDEPTTMGIPSLRGRTIDREKLKNSIDELYAHKGWDENGAPTPETLKRLGIDKEPSHKL